MSALEYSLKINCDVETQSTRYCNSLTKIQRHLCIWKALTFTPNPRVWVRRCIPRAGYFCRSHLTSLTCLNLPNELLVHRVLSTQQLIQNMAQSRRSINICRWRGNNLLEAPSEEKLFSASWWSLILFSQIMYVIVPSTEYVLNEF